MIADDRAESSAPKPAPKSVSDAIAHWLAVWFGCGHVPIAPGTAGTIGAVPLYLLLRSHGPIAVLIVAFALLLPGVWAADRVAARTKLKDPQIVVVDEVIGVLITLAAAPHSWLGVLAGFILFRAFDQFKPWPARAFEQKLRGGWGIVMDDVAAGVWGAIVLVVARAAGWAG